MDSGARVSYNEPDPGESEAFSGMLRTTYVLFLSLAAACSSLAAADLRDLIQEYTTAKAKAHGGDLAQRLQRAKTLKPVLLRIGKLDTPDALGFLEKEFAKESPEIAAACVEPILAIVSSDKVFDLLLGGFPKRPPVVKQEVIVQLTATKRDISALEATLIGLLSSETAPGVKKEFPALLARFGTPAAARALLGGLGARNQRLKGKAAEEADEFDRRVVQVLKQAKSEAVKEWLAREAFTSATPTRLAALAAIVGALKLEAARPELEKRLDEADERTAVECLDALLKLGAGPSTARIAESLRRGKRSLPFRIQALDSLAASGNAECVAAVREAAREHDPETRAIALGSLARVPGTNQEAFQGILGGLKDGDATVRGAAVRALQRIRHKEMVPALIEVLASEKDEKLKIDAVQLLVLVTGKNMGLEAPDWRKWWEVAEPKFEFPKGDVKIATAGKSHDLKYFGIEISSKRLGFLLDASGSMLENVDVYVRPEGEGKVPEEAGKTRAGGEGASGDKKGGQEGEKKTGQKTKARKLDVLKKEMGRVVAELPRDTHINIVTFSAAYKAWQDTLQPLAGSGRERAMAFVKDIQTASGTNVFDTLEFALKDKRVDTIFLLTDGLPTKGRFRDAPSILREVAALNRVRGVVINCVAFGEECQLLKDLAKENGGVYRFVDRY